MPLGLFYSAIKAFQCGGVAGWLIASFVIPSVLVVCFTLLIRMEFSSWLHPTTPVGAAFLSVCGAAFFSYRLLGCGGSVSLVDLLVPFVASLALVRY